MSTPVQNSAYNMITRIHLLECIWNKCQNECKTVLELLYQLDLHLIGWWLMGKLQNADPEGIGLLIVAVCMKKLLQ